MNTKLSPQDLNLVDLTKREVDRIVAIRAGCSAGVVIGAWTGAHFLVGSRPGPMWGIALAFAVTGTIVATQRSYVARAARARNEMNLALAVFFDLTNVMLAGGMGVESAVIAAAAAGDSPAFDRIRVTLSRSQSARTSYWEALRNLGDETGIESLVDIASSAQLAGEFGARIRQTLVAKARGLRQRNLAQVEHDAETRTEKLGLPLVVLFMAFILLIGYPAFVRTVSSF